MRVRDIIHRDGPRLRLTLAPGEGGDGPLFRLSDPAGATPGTILLDLYAVELLAGFLMSARLAAAADLPDECCTGDYPMRLRLCATGREVSVELEQVGQRLRLVRPLWDRLYAELQLARAHGRHLGEAAQAYNSALPEGTRLRH